MSYDRNLADGDTSNFLVLEGTEVDAFAVRNTVCSRPEFKLQFTFTNGKPIPPEIEWYLAPIPKKGSYAEVIIEHIDGSNVAIKCSRNAVPIIEDDALGLSRYEKPIEDRPEEYLTPFQKFLENKLS